MTGRSDSTARWTTAVSVAAGVALAASGVGRLAVASAPADDAALQAAAPGARQGGGGRRGGRGGGIGAAFFTVADVNKDGSLTRPELRTTFDGWASAWDRGSAGSLASEETAPITRARW